MSVPLLIYGLQRTCTNLVKRLLDCAECYEANGEHAGRGWKHAPIDADLARQPIDGQHPRLVLCVRQPADWLRSCYRYFGSEKGKDRTVCPHFLRAWTFDQFCRKPSYTWPHPVARWNEYYAAGWTVVQDWIRQGRPAAIVRAEDLQTAAGQLEEVARLVDRLGLDLRRSPQAIARRVDNRGHLTRVLFDPEEYARRIAQDWTPELQAWVRQAVDCDVARQFGYGTDKTDRT